MQKTIPGEDKTAISLRGVHKSFASTYGPHPAVVNLSLDIAPGETICLVGPSGCGKTTTLRMLNRLIAPSAGCIQINGTDSGSLNLISLRRQMGYVVQSGGLFPHLTVAQNIGLLCKLEAWPRPQIEARVNSLLALVNLPEAFRTRYPCDLSGGQRQRVGVARALALDPPFLLMDEPFGALDPITRNQMQQEFLDLRQTVQKTTVLVTHDMDEAFQLGDRVALMENGELVQVGTEEDFRTRPKSAFVSDFFSAHRGPSSL